MTSAFSAKLCQPLTCFVLYSTAKFACCFRYLLTSYLCIPVPYIEKDIFWGCQFQKVMQVFIESFSFFSITGRGIDLDCCDTEWFALETSPDHLVIFETVSKFAFQTLVNCEGYSISSKGFLPTQQIQWSSELNLRSPDHLHSFLRYQCSLLPSPA